MFTGRLPSFANTRSMRVAGGLGTIPRGRRRAGNLSRAAFRRRRAGADRGALQAVSPRAAAADQQGPSGVRNRDPGGLPFDAVGRGVARRAAAARYRDRRPLRHQLREPAARCRRGDHERARLFDRPQQALCRRLHHRQPPASGLHTVQLELNRAIYMDERRRERSPRFAQVAADFAALADALAQCRSGISGRSRRRRSSFRHSGRRAAAIRIESLRQDACLGWRLKMKDGPKEKRAA